MKIHFQNEAFIVLDKAAGDLSVPSRFPDRDTRLVAGLELEKQIGQKIFPIHRLDCEVSGILLFALSPEAHRDANQIFEKHQVQKIYQAVSSQIRGEIPEIGSEYNWKAKVLRGKKRSFESPHGKLSHTEAQFLGEYDLKKYKWNLKPITGRSHQLRFDLARHGFPIWGDVLYGGEPVEEPDKIFLRACHLQFLNKDFFTKWKLPKEFSLKGFF